MQGIQNSQKRKAKFSLWNEQMCKGIFSLNRRNALKVISNRAPLSLRIGSAFIRSLKNFSGSGRGCAWTYQTNCPWCWAVDCQWVHPCRFSSNGSLQLKTDRQKPQTLGFPLWSCDSLSCLCQVLKIKMKYFQKRRRVNSFASQVPTTKSICNSISQHDDSVNFWQSVAHRQGTHLAQVIQRSPFSCGKCDIKEKAQN